MGNCQVDVLFYSYHFCHLFIYNVACDQFIHRKKFIDSVWSRIQHLQKIYCIILATLQTLSFSLSLVFLFFILKNSLEGKSFKNVQSMCHVQFSINQINILRNKNNSILDRLLTSDNKINMRYRKKKKNIKENK